jgi:hypothetical protein
MTASAVEFYIQGLLDGQAVLGTDDLSPIQAWVLPPAVVQLMPSPQVFVWGGVFDEERHTLPRGSGEKRVAYQISVWVQLATANEDINNDFVLCLQTIMRILRTVKIPVPLLDTQTGEASILQTIGEKFRVQHPAPVASADQRMLLHNATITVYASEEFDG